jgi:hypothetical protein
MTDLAQLSEEWAEVLRHQLDYVKPACLSTFELESRRLGSREGTRPPFMCSRAAALLRGCFQLDWPVQLERDQETKFRKTCHADL